MRWLVVTVVLAGCGSGKEGPVVDSDAPVDTELPDTDVVRSTDVPDTDTDVVDDTDTDLPVAATCHLGWGETEFHALADGDDAPVRLGGQGRWHVPGAVYCEGIDPGRSLLDVAFGVEGVEPAVSWRILTPDGDFLGGYPPNGSSTPLYRPMSTPGGPALQNELLILSTPCFEAALGRDAVMSFVLTDKNGAHVETSVSIHLVDARTLVDHDTDLAIDTDADTDVCP